MTTPPAHPTSRRSHSSPASTRVAARFSRTARTTHEPPEIPHPPRKLEEAQPWSSGSWVPWRYTTPTGRCP